MAANCSLGKVKVMGQKKQLLWGTIILTATGFLSRLIGFFYRIFLSHTIGAEGLGIYQLVFPVQALCLALTVMGMSTAISLFVASRFAVKDLKGAHDIFLVGTGVSVLFACLVSWVIRVNASFLSSVFLGEPRTESLLCLMSWSLPLCALHNCINGYFYAQKKTGIPAASQLLEQFVRVATAYLAYSFLLSRGQEPTAWIAVIGIFTSELCVVLFCLFFLLWNHQKSKLLLFPIQEPFGHLRRLMGMYLPLTMNRLIMTFLASAEAILIPSRLLIFGYTSSTALSIYGVLTGMALPMILFPSAVTNSISVMLLPSIAQQQALGQKKQIQKTIELTVQCCLLLGFLCTAFFAVFGTFIGNFLFHNELAGSFIQTLAFVCPFLYLNGTLNSVLNGLGKTGTSLIHSILGITLRIASVIWIIPRYSIQGYLWGLLAGEVLVTFLHLHALNRIVQINFRLLPLRLNK